MRSHLRRVALALLWLMQPAGTGEATAADFLFTSIITVTDGVGAAPASEVAETNDLRDLSDQLSTINMAALFPTENWNNPDQVDVTALMNLRGVYLGLAFPAGGTELVVSLPFLGVDVRFDAGDRDESAEQFEDWLRGEFHDDAAPDSVLTALLQELVAQSPVDPVAGNPNSLQSKMFEAAFFTGTTGVYRPRPGTKEAEEWTGRDRFRATGRYEYFKGGPWQGNVWEGALDYQVNFRNPRFALLFDIPFVVTQTESSESYLVSVGLGVQIRPTHWWNLTPSVRLGGAGSFKLGAVAIMSNVNLTSSMRWEIGAREVSIGGRTLGIPDFELGIGNMFGWNGTFDELEIAGMRIAYELNNYAIRNGIDLTMRLPGQILGSRPAVQLFFADTWILGSQLFLDHYNELGLKVGTQRQTGGKWRDSLAFHTAWVFGNQYNALQLRLSYRF